MIAIDIQKELHGQEGVMQLQLDLQIRKGQLVTFYGESGAGKTSVLRMLSGLLKPDKGTISVGEETWYDSHKGLNLKPQKRNIGFVFQDYALFPHMTVLQNLEYASKTRKTGAVLGKLIEIVELGDLQNRKPQTLSGGQKQRVALARALVQRPEILLLDEPLSALDHQIRIKLQEYLLTAHREFELTTILVSHDIGEICKLSDWVFVLQQGQLLKQGNPSDLFINEKLSGKFKFTGEVLNIAKEEVIYIVTVLVQNNIVKVVAQESEIRHLNVGDKVVVASKAFNPVIHKIE